MLQKEVVAYTVIIITIIITIVIIIFIIFAKVKVSNISLFRLAHASRSRLLGLHQVRDL